MSNFEYRITAWTDMVGSKVVGEWQDAGHADNPDEVAAELQDGGCSDALDEVLRMVGLDWSIEVREVGGDE